MGVDRRTRCEYDATKEDGLCDKCRCPHGCCADHGDEAKWDSMMIFDDPMAFMEWFARAREDLERCRLNQGYKELKQAFKTDEEQKEGE
jgi:hypothetical protein